ncbi:PEP/pyruvate-binding domain-containing protein [Herbivorax sp. ANBcel31]|uniref:PEP/pyruvate-binding domain-containing protein n=1 Tax=Herbivorax sp. ANBcel31 TaxID=3069754 RepID=UPI0027B0B581|nr:PEP/pyruvate-binding domain-containing protein [Herbivorax sp. ANBcel31]MDQ2087307.1 PEP/pyruvate-binding domain-containing protein [Herbivorax sp. ANBcel31]
MNTKLLRNVTKDDFSLAGGKAANLGEMIKAGLPVPEGFVVSTDAYDKFIEANNFKDKIENILKNINKDNLKEMEKASNKIQELFEAGSIPEDVLFDINKCYELIGNPETAVRSSSTAEDLPGFSFAGQYSTYLNVKGIEELHKYVKKCWASLWNFRAVSYRIQQNIGNKNLAHGVVVQKLINAKKSGILFTANPVNGRRDQMLLNSSWGIGEAIVGGEVNPDQWILDKNNGSVVEEKIAEKSVMTVRKEKGIELVKVEGKNKTECTLNSSEINELYKMAKKAEDYFGSSQDIEWAYMDGKFYLVQTRPITSLYPMPEKKKGKDGLRVFLNMNSYSQAMKEPFTPMGEDLMKSSIHSLILKYGKKKFNGDRMWWYQNVGGRLFLDITDFMRTEKSWGKFKKEDKTDKDPVTTKALLQLVERNRDEILDKKQSVKLLGKMNSRLGKFLLSGGTKFFYGIFSPVKARKKAVKVSEDEIIKLKEDIKELNSIEEKLLYIEKNTGDFIMNGAILLCYVAVSSTYIGKAKKIMQKHLEDISDLYIVEKSVPHSATTQMGMSILELSKKYDERGKRPKATDKEIKEFMKTYGHKSSVELDVGVATWEEEPGYVLDLINTYIDNKNYQEGIDRFYKGKEEAEMAIQRIKRNLEEKGQKKDAKRVEKMLKDFREMFGIREQSKFFITELLSMLRKLYIEVGKELQKAGRFQDKMDIFYVRFNDIRSNKNLKEIAENNKEIYKRNFLKAAPRLLTSTGESIYSAVEQRREDGLYGVPVSPGVYEGRVRILHNPEDGNKLEKGEILVTTGTNPAWTPLFLKIGALIMETGGSISHGSVVAREYGVPAVAGVAGATQELKDGQMVRVNGEDGSIKTISS